MLPLVLFLLFFLQTGKDPQIYTKVSMGNKFSYGVTSSKDFKGIVPLLDQRDKLCKSTHCYATCNFFTNHSHLEFTENLLYM